MQVAITIFLLVMAALMIPGGKLTDRYGRVRLFRLGLVVYGVGALLSAVAPGLGVLIVGNSILEGVGTALLIPPVYILTTLLFTGVTSRARAFGVISAMGGVGSAAGPLIGGLITSAISWRAAFVFQALVIAAIVLLSRRLDDPLPADPTRPFDLLGAALSAVGLVLLVSGIMAADTNVWLMIALIAAGALVLMWFFQSVRAKERAGQEPLLSTALFRNRTSNLGLVTQNVQWLLLLGSSFTVAAYLQVVRGYDAIQTGVIFTGGDGRHTGFVARRRTASQAVRAAEPRPRRLHRHDRRYRGTDCHGERLAERLGVRARSAADRTRARHHADPVGQHRAVQLRRGTPGRDLRPVALHIEPRLLPRHGDCGHHPRRESQQGWLRRGDDHACRHRPDRASGRDTPPTPPGCDRGRLGSTGTR